MPKLKAELRAFQLNTIQRITETSTSESQSARLNDVSIKHYPTNN